MAVFHVTFMAETLGRTVPLVVILPTDKFYFGNMPRREVGESDGGLRMRQCITAACLIRNRDL